jgi:hypothetical protein
MSDSTDYGLGRRRFIAGGAAAAGFAAAMAGAEARAAIALEISGPAGISVVLYDPRLAISADDLRRLDAKGTRIIALNGDPVWFWRSAAGSVLRDPDTQLLGITGWAELLVFRGLAAETRRHLRYEKLTSDATFTWLIA